MQKMEKYFHNLLIVSAGFVYPFYTEFVFLFVFYLHVYSSKRGTSEVHEYTIRNCSVCVFFCLCPYKIVFGIIVIYVVIII